MAQNKPIIMLHYSEYGSQRSPNMQFDMVRHHPVLSEKYEFVTLDQPESPKKHGHIRSIIELKKKIKACSPYAVHIIGVKEGFHCVIAAWLAGCKNRILVTHGFAGVSSVNNFARRFIFQNIIEPITLILSTKVQCNSNFSMNQKIIKRFASKKSYIIYNFLNVNDALLSSDNAWRVNNGINDKDFLVITVGNMHLGKGYDILTDVIEKTKKYPNIKFVVIGDGVYRKVFEKDNNEHIKNRKVICTGFLPFDITMSIMSQSDLFYLPTKYETLGMVFAEAGFCSLPSIGTNVGAVGEIIKDGETGFIIDQKDSCQAANIIYDLFNNRNKGIAMGKRARKHIEKLFNNEYIATQILKKYDDC